MTPSATSTTQPATTSRRVLLLGVPALLEPTLATVQSVVGEKNAFVVDKLPAAPELDQVDLVVTTVDELGGSHAGWLEALRSPLVVLTSTVPHRGPLQTLFERNNIAHVLDRQNQRDLLATVRRLVDGSRGGLDAYLGKEAMGAHCGLTTSGDRARLLREVEGFVSRLPVNPRLRQMIIAVADELASNALYDAPTTPTGGARFRHLARTVDVALEPNELIDVALAWDGERFGISATDPFGALTRHDVTQTLLRCLRGGPDQVSRRSGGAGLGLYFLLESTNHLVVDVVPGRKTEVIGLISANGTYRDFLSSGKSFSFFGG